MYINAQLSGKNVIVWERNEDGVRETLLYPAEFFYFKEDPQGEYLSLYGDKLARVECSTRGKMYNELKSLKEQGIKTFEGDISPEFKILSDHYYGEPAPKLTIGFYDIEVDYDPKRGFASPMDPYAPINSLALHNYALDKTVVYCIPPPHRMGDRPDSEIEEALLEFAAKFKHAAEINFCRTEEELLIKFLDDIEDIDCLVGWNSSFFDDPYIAMRIKRMDMHGKKSTFFKRLSFPEGREPRFGEVEVYGNKNKKVDFFGRIQFDYLQLFRKYDTAERPSYKLESIAEEMVPDLPKLEYEGTLHGLYRDDFEKFVEYNIRDTEILKGLEDKLGYVQLANEMYHMSCGLPRNVFGTIKLAELSLVNYCHYELGVYCPDTDYDAKPKTEDEKIQGAFVLSPKAGLHEWCASVDINSLYPSAIRAVNISPETLEFQLLGTTMDFSEIHAGDPETIIEMHCRKRDQVLSTTVGELRSLLENSDYAISGYGTIFNQNKKGMIPTVLEQWYSLRKKFQGLKKEALAKGDNDQADYYDRIQYTYKIKLNSLYGALSNKFFKFYDKAMGESVTATGQEILKFQCSRVNELLTGKYDPFGEAIVYGDTDSSYFKTFASDKEEAILVGETVASAVNKSFPEFMEKGFFCGPEYKDLIVCGREIVSDNGIFIDKKRYILHIVDNEGEPCDKLKIMGVELKKTTLPKAISKELSGFIERLLKGESWESVSQSILEYKLYLNNLDVDGIGILGLPKGVQKVEHYTDVFARETQRLGMSKEDQKHLSRLPTIPGHVRASILWNTGIQLFEDTDSLPITSGMKIKVYYIKHDKKSKFKAIAMPTDSEMIPQWFIDEYYPILDRNEQIQRLVDDPLNNIVKAIGVEVPTIDLEHYEEYAEAV